MAVLFFSNIGQEQFNIMNSTGKAREGFLLGYSLKDICCDVKTERVMSTDGGECMGSVSTHEGNSTVTILTIGGFARLTPGCVQVKTVGRNTIDRS